MDIWIWICAYVCANLHMHVCNIFFSTCLLYFPRIFFFYYYCSVLSIHISLYRYCVRSNRFFGTYVRVQYTSRIIIIIIIIIYTRIYRFASSTCHFIQYTYRQRRKIDRETIHTQNIHTDCIVCACKLKLFNSQMYWYWHAHMYCIGRCCCCCSDIHIEYLIFGIDIIYTRILVYTKRLPVQIENNNNTLWIYIQYTYRQTAPALRRKISSRLFNSGNWDEEDTGGREGYKREWVSGKNTKVNNYINIYKFVCACMSPAKLFLSLSLFA